ncbi:hypothetical protein B0H15DRAFT_927250 [Mycena belliarum]|uniref:Uncharacterized protein n=1 Tax=Mycena belliarum TaxID=1033014 RepID=A0AAD6UK83_9AGAR|nr:hypothetical protein B0H15DRAFT_927250 [Mycena belliae]
MPERYTATDDNNLVRFLADPERIRVDPTISGLYKELGPGSAEKWSRDHKPTGWQRRATQIADLDSKILAAARNDVDVKPSKANLVKKAQEDDALDRKKAVELVLTKKKGARSAQTLPAASIVDRDTWILAEEFGVDSEVVNDIIRQYGSVVRATEIISLLKKDSGRVEEGSDEPSAPASSKLKSVGKSQRRRSDEDEDDGSSSDEEPLKSSGVKPKSVRAPKTPASRKVPKKPTRRTYRSDDSDEELVQRAPKKARSRFQNPAIRPAPYAHVPRVNRGPAVELIAKFDAISVDTFYGLRPRFKFGL